MNFKFRHQVPRFDLRGLLGALLLMLISGSTLAQSGRTGTGSTAPAKPTVITEITSPTSDSSPASKVAKEAKTRLIAAKYVSATNTGFETGIAYRSFLARLQESGFLIVSSREDIRRKEAIELARHDENVYVAWFQLELDLMGSADVKTDAEKAAVTPINPGCLYVTYAIFEPGSGRAIAQGHTYQPGYQDRCAGTVYHPSPYPDRQIVSNRTVPELELKRAGSEAADRVMEALNITIPPKHP